MSLCRSGDHEVAKAAARGLVRFPSHRATAAVLGLLEHERWDVRWAAAEVLAERGDLTALAPLRRVQVIEPDPLVRQVLAGAVGRLESLAAANRAEPTA
jgi:HEAT repeat protein